MHATRIVMSRKRKAVFSEEEKLTQAFDDGMYWKENDGKQVEQR